MKMSAEPVRIVRLTTGPDGGSHFVEDALAMSVREFAPPAAPFDVSDTAAASGVVFWRAPAGWHGQPHPTPARQWVFVRAGAIEIEASDGQTRTLNAGDGLLLEDVTGKGHATRVRGDQAALGIFIQTPSGD